MTRFKHLILFAWLLPVVTSAIGTDEGSALTRNEITEAQKMLAFFGMYRREIDGLDGPKTAESVREYQKKRGLPVDGTLTRNLLNDLRSEYRNNTTPEPHEALKKCSMYALQFWSPPAVGEVVGGNGERSSVTVEPDRAWALKMYKKCAKSCAEKNWWSRTFGDCRK